MPFQKGISGNPAGKKKGTKNKVTLAAKATLEHYMLEQGGIVKIFADIENLRANGDDAKAAEISIKLLPYIMPKQQAIEQTIHDGSIEGVQIKIVHKDDIQDAQVIGEGDSE